jgi:branched-chain amino acid transport system permease protein
MSSRDVAVPALTVSPSRRAAWLALALAAIAVAPLIFQDSYWRTNLVVCALNVMLVIGLDFILGYAGQLNLGHSAFFGIGAYVSTLLIMLLGVPYWAAFLVAMLLAGAAGAALSLFASRSPRSASRSSSTRY